MTVNMSRSGVLMECRNDDVATERAAVVIGDFIQVEIELPALQNNQPRCISCIGQIARLDSGIGKEYIAVSIRTLQFRDAAAADMLPERLSTALVM